jgi:hypothetical protein
MGSEVETPRDSNLKYKISYYFFFKESHFNHYDDRPGDEIPLTLRFYVYYWALSFPTWDII